MFGIIALFGVLRLVLSSQIQDKNSLVLVEQLKGGLVELTCASTEVSKAVEWTTPIDYDFIPKDFEYSNKVEIIPDGWSIVSSLNLNLGLVLDERWEGFSTTYSVSSREEFVFESLGSINSFSSNYIPISVKAKQEANIYICKNSDAPPPRNDCYWIILGGWSNTRSALRKCRKNEINTSSQPPLRECSILRAENNTIRLNEYEWKHFTVILDNKTKSISVVFDGDVAPFLHYQDDNLVDDVGEVFVTSTLDQKAFWKLQECMYKLKPILKQIIIKPRISKTKNFLRDK